MFKKSLLWTFAILSLATAIYVFLNKFSLKLESDPQQSSTAQTNKIKVYSGAIKIAEVPLKQKTTDSATTALDYNLDEPLQPEEEKQFFAEIDDLFAKKAYSYANPDDLSQNLSDLNARLRRGVHSIKNRLNTVSASDEEAMLKMSLVDYLNYRAKWDDKVREDIVEIVSRPVKEIGNLRYRATKIAENAELIAGLANLDLERALLVVKDLKEPLMFRYAASAIHDSLINKGLSWNEATEKIRAHLPGYERKALTTDSKTKTRKGA